MPDPANQPREYDAVKGGQNQPPIDAAVLGGISGVKSRLASIALEARIVALSEALKYGDAGLDLVVAALQDESMQIGWFLHSITDSYHIYEHLKFKQILSIPAHRDRDWKYGTLRALMAKIAQHQQQSGDVATDFSRTNNPNGVWSYGWTPNLRSPFIMCNDPRVREGLDSWCGNRAPDGNPGVYFNATGSPIVLCTTTRLEPGQFALHPGPAGEYALVRWTAPETGNISIASVFTGLNFVGPTTTDVHILLNDRSIFDNFVEGFGDDSAVRFNTNFAVIQGDTIDFAVGFGRNRTYYHDTTGLAATIALTAP